jgi:hypothetical protein
MLFAVRHSSEAVSQGHEAVTERRVQEGSAIESTRMRMEGVLSEL